MTFTNVQPHRLPPNYVNLVADFGAVSNVSATNSTTSSTLANDTAWNNFITYGLAETAAGRSVALYVPPGFYSHRGNNIINATGGAGNTTAYNTFSKISKMTILGDGATFYNIYDSTQAGAGPNYAYSLPFMVSGGGMVSDLSNCWLLANSSTGSNSTHLITSADYSHLTPNTYYMIASTNIMPTGSFPWNHDKYDFVVLTGAYANGLITFDRPLKTDHYSNEGIDQVGGAAQVYAAARIWEFVSWDLEHFYKGFTVLPAYDNIYNSGTYGGTPCWQVNGKYVYVENCTLPAFTSQWGKIHSFNRCRFLNYPSEPDKIVENMTFTDCFFANSINFQSSSFQTVSFKGCTIQNLGTGAAQNIKVEDCEIGVFGLSGPDSYGVNRNTTVINSTIRSFPGQRFGDWGTPEGGLHDANHMVYANGVFTLFRANTSLTYFPSVIVGDRLAFVVNNAADYPHPGDIGSGVVVSITQDAANAYVKTTIPQASWPSWAKGE